MWLCRVDGSTYRKLFWVSSQQKYCREVKVGGRRTYVPYDPQPSQDSVVILHRYYATLAANGEYKRRVTWLVDSDDKVGELAVFEYFGQHVTGGPHGNSKKPNAAPFIRTPAATMEKISDKNKTQRPQDVYNDLIVDSDIASAPRDSRVVRNSKATSVRADKAAKGHSSCPTFADEMQVVMDLLKTDNFIRRVCAQKDCVPSVILYTDRQIADIKGLCFNREHGSVIGVDKTFNLGSIYVTACVYKNIALNRIRSGD